MQMTLSHLMSHYCSWFLILTNIAVFDLIFSLRYGVQDMDGSAKRIYESVLRAPEGHIVILLAHNGPTGVSVCQHQI